ncbi:MULTISPECIES: PAS domain-containing protein [unclassified Streptomyces]|uniref:PAS domain-containing protein n=1 Tax=unclassified Streptomyces TaxID=2593676 RepID=UPI0022AEC8BE|nr:MULTISPECIES: PAS domain-containing protein [unclassified Streptomyces]MCZ4101509.1 PAS domain-containing protein [Streptomyces sp. H39-C1]
MQPFDAKPLSDGDEQLLAALLDGMEAGLCAFDRDGVITHWNSEAVRILGWSADDAVGRRGFSGWAARSADAHDVQTRLLGAMDAPGRQVHEFALLTKDGHRVLVRTQSAAVQGQDGRPAGVYCAFSEVHAQIDLERSIALSEALFDDASWGVVLIDADLRPAVVNAHAARLLRTGRDTLLGRPLGDLLEQGLEELETALQHVLAEGSPPVPSELWLSLRGDESAKRHCWRSGFVRLGSPLGEEPVPLGVGWLFLDVTEAKLAEQEGSLLRFRHNQLHRAGRTASECEDPVEAATTYLDFALAGFADHALVDLAGDDGRLVRAASTPEGSSGPCLPVPVGTIPVAYGAAHPVLQAVERIGTVRASFGALAAAEPASRARIDEWAAARRWPEGTVHGLSTVLRSRGRTLGAVTFLRGAGRRLFDRSDAAYAEDVAVRVAAALDLAQQLG